MSHSPTDVTRTYAGTTALSTSERHRVLAADRRRIALDYLADRTGPVDVEELAASIAARESDENIAGDDTVQQVAVTLHHVHLPKLAEFGVVDYEPAEQVVESGPPSA